MKVLPLNKNVVYYEAGEVIDVGPGWKTTITDTGWYYKDETGMIANGPYTTGEMAHQALQCYAKNLGSTSES